MTSTTTTTTDSHSDTYWSQLSDYMLDKVIGQEYQLLEVLGHGAYGCLFLGQSNKNNAYVAVKVLTKSGLDLQQLQYQQLEIDIQSAFKHNNLLALHRVIHDKDYIYMVMELCDQGDLFDFVIRDQDVNPLRQNSLVKNIFLQILDGVAHMHDIGIYHRDIKLENILLKCENDNDEDDLTCKVADFGLATRERYSMEFGCGSTSYLAPEHFDDSDETKEIVPYDAAASDAWSLGILLLALMFGRNPWQEASCADSAFSEFKRNPAMLKETMFPELSMAAFRFLKSALALDGTDRATVAELKQQFSEIKHLYAEDEADELPLPTAITTPMLVAAAAKRSDISSFDSAFFSAGTGSSSWSDMVEEEEEEVLHKSNDFDYNYQRSSDPCRDDNENHYSPAPCYGAATHIDHHPKHHHYSLDLCDDNENITTAPPGNHYFHDHYDNKEDKAFYHSRDDACYDHDEDQGHHYYPEPFYDNHKEETSLFIHSNEEESWWL